MRCGSPWTPRAIQRPGATASSPSRSWPARPWAEKGPPETSIEGTRGSPYLKATPVVDAQVLTPKVGVPVLWWRSVGATHAAYVMEHTIDQLARRAGKDPVAYRRALYARAGANRHLAVLNTAADKAGWDGPPPAGW